MIHHGIFQIVPFIVKNSLDNPTCFWSRSEELNGPSGLVFQVEVENFVLKMAAEFPSRRDQLIFLINNYDMMLSVLMVSPVQRRLPRLR